MANTAKLNKKVIVFIYNRQFTNALKLSMLRLFLPGLNFFKKEISIIYKNWKIIFLKTYLKINILTSNYLYITIHIIQR